MNQPVDYVAIVNPVLATTAKPIERLDLTLRVPDFQMVGVHHHVQFLADQTAVDRIGVAVDQAAAVDRTLSRLAWSNRRAGNGRKLSHGNF